MLYENCLVRCVRVNSWENNFTEGKLYRVINGRLECDTGYVYEPDNGKPAIKWLSLWYTFEVVENYDTLICSVCGEVITGNDWDDVRGMVVCHDCRESVHICYECGRAVVGDDIEHAYGHELCPRCFAQYYTTCDCCGEIVHRYDTWSTDCGDNICPDCRDEYYLECSECGELVYRDYVHWHNDNPYCHSCYDDMQNRVIQGYYYKPAPIFYGCSPCNNPLYMGVELEIDGAGEDDSKAQRLVDIANEFDEHIYCKHDGSIGDGFEIVSHPATLDYHMRDIAWNDIMRSALDMGYRSHDTDTCGLHVHVSRNALGNTMDERDETISKIVYFIEKNWNEVLRFTRRTESNLRRWASRYGIETDAKTTYKKAKGDYNRYRCINLQNDHTIEFRIFRGTLKYTTFVATLQLVNEICNICKCSSVESIENMEWNEFISRIDTENRAELVEYLKIRGLYV